MKVAIYCDLPQGGASKHTEEIINKYQKLGEVTLYKSKLTIPGNRLLRDLTSIFLSKREAKILAAKINKEHDLVYITHDRYFQAPWILRYLTIQTVFYIHEPTRAFFEAELGIDSSWPLINQLYERIIRNIKKKIEISNASYAREVLTNSKYMQSYIQNAYGLSAKVENPKIDHQIFKNLALKKKTQILWIGNDEPQKRLRLAIDALAVVRDAPTLVVVSPRFAVTSSTLAYAKSRNVKLVSKVGITQEELVKEYNYSLLTLATALREPFGYSPLESLSCGTPVVAVNEGGFVENLHGKGSVVLVNANPAEIADAIKVFI